MFLIDAQLPPIPKVVFTEFGVPSIHVLDILNRDETPDQEIAQFADKEDTVVVHCGLGCCFPHTLKKSPRKLLLITTGNLKNRQLCQFIGASTGSLITLFDLNTFIESKNQGIIVHE